MNKTKLQSAISGAFFMPMGSAVQPISQSWYSINAKANNSAEVWLYDEIGGWGVTARQFAQDIKALGDIKHIDVRIHSPGGDVFEGMAIYNLLKNHPAVVHAHIDGLAASMASVIAMAADVIHMPENANDDDPQTLGHSRR